MAVRVPVAGGLAAGHAPLGRRLLSRRRSSARRERRRDSDAAPV